MIRWFQVSAAAVAVSVLTSCASLTVNDLPQPGTSYSDGYNIVLEFENVLNLPDRAKVVMDGTTVGVVSKVDIVGDKVNVTSRLDGAVQVPSNVRAILQQATVLGDIYVALERDPSSTESATPVEPGAVIPLAQTVSPPPLESTIANLANFVASGSIQRAQNTIIGINRLHQSTGVEVRAVATRVVSDLTDLSNNIDLVDHWLDGVSGTVDVMHRSVPSFQYWFSPEGMLAFDRGTFVSTYIATLLPGIGSVYSDGYWLVPMLASLADTAGAIQQSKWAVEEEVPAWQELFTDFYLPQDKYPAINITSIVGPDGRELSGDVQDVLRMLGAVP